MTYEKQGFVMITRANNSLRIYSKFSEDLSEIHHPSTCLL